MPLAPAAQKSFTKWLAMIAENDFRDLPSIIAADAIFRSPVGLEPYPGRDLVCLLLSTAAGVFEDFNITANSLDGENAALEFRSSEPLQCDGRVDRAASESVICSRVTGMAI